MKKITRKIKEKFKKVEINLGPNQRRLGSLVLGLGIVGAVFGLSVVPVFAKEAAPKPAPAPSLDNENLKIQLRLQVVLQQLFVQVPFIPGFLA